MVNFRLKEIVLSIASGITINHSSKGTYPVYGSTGIIGYTNSNDYSGERILIARVGANAGATNIVCGEYGVSDNTLVITVHSEYEIKYIYYCLKHKKLNQFVFGSGQPLITGSLLKNISLYIPDRISQQHIAEALSDVDGMISLLEKLVAKYKSIKTACLQQMFPQNGETVPRMRLPGFTGAWEQRKLGDIADIVGGGTPSTGNQSYWDGDIDWYAPAEIADQIYANSSQKKITSLGYENSSAKMLPPGTVLFTSRAGIGKTAILTRKGCTNQGFQSIVPHRGELDSYFIFSRTEELKRYGELVGAGSTFVEVSGKQMTAMELMMPPSMREQQTIGGFFQHLDNLITLHQRKPLI